MVPLAARLVKGNSRRLKDLPAPVDFRIEKGRQPRRSLLRGRVLDCLLDFGGEYTIVLGKLRE